MADRRKQEIAVGIFIAAGIAALFMLAMRVSNLSAFQDNGGYSVSARFDNIGNLKVRAPVRMGGVRVGRVTAISYDSEYYEAVVTLTLNEQFNRIPVDSSANIYTAGLLGEQYIGLEPGGAEDYLKQGDRLSETQSAFVLERLIGQYLINASSSKD